MDDDVSPADHEHDTRQEDHTNHEHDPGDTGHDGHDNHTGPDLATVLRRVTDPDTGTRKTAAARERLANDDITRELLEAGLRVLEEEFGYSATHAPPPGGSSRFFDFLSAARVTAEVRTAGNLMATPAHLRDRWPYHAHFVDDLLAFGLSRHHWLAHVAEADRSLEILESAEDLETAAREIAYLNVIRLQQLPTYRLTVLAATVAAARPELRVVLEGVYAYLCDGWSELYRRLLARFGLRLREGVTLDEMTGMLIALAEGLGLRVFALGDDGLVDHETHESLLARAALTILRACTEPDPDAVS